MQDEFKKMGYPMQRILRTTSPVVLTEYGKKLVEESGFNQIFHENWLITNINQNKNMVKVEIEEFNEKTGKWETRIEEEEGDFVFSTTTNAPREKLKLKKANKKK